MRVISTKRLQPGQVLARPVFSARNVYHPLVTAGVPITEELKAGLLTHGIAAVYVEDMISQGIEVELSLSESEQFVVQTSEQISRTITDVSEATSLGMTIPRETVADLQKVADRLADEILVHGDVVVALQDLADVDQYTIRHSLDVAVIGLLIGNRLFRQSGWENYRGEREYDFLHEKLTKLGLGLILHDIGKIVIPPLLLHKTDLNDEERELVRTHTTTGADIILKAETIPASVRAVARSHHERWDGSGYPYGLVGEKIHQNARIAAVANVFDSLTSDKPNQPAAPLSYGYERISFGWGTQFDPEVVDVFRRVVAPFPPGSEVEIEDGRKAIVVKVFEDNLARPLIRIYANPDGSECDLYELDLREEPGIVIAGM